MEEMEESWRKGIAEAREELGKIKRSVEYVEKIVDNLERLWVKERGRGEREEVKTRERTKEEEEFRGKRGVKEVGGEGRADEGSKRNEEERGREVGKRKERVEKKIEKTGRKKKAGRKEDRGNRMEEDEGGSKEDKEEGDKDDEEDKGEREGRVNTAIENVWREVMRSRGREETGRLRKKTKEEARTDGGR